MVHLIVSIMFGTTMGCWPTYSQPADSKTARQIDQVLIEIQTALQKVQTEAANANLPQLASVSLELAAEFDYSTGGELNLYIVSLGTSTDNESTQRIKLTLTPPKPYAEEPVASGLVSESLSSAILAAAKGVANVQNRQPKLTLSKLETELRFVAKSTGQGGLKIELLPITVGLKGEAKKSDVQTITITFGETAK